MDTSNAFDLRLPAEMAKVAEQAGLYKVSKKKELSFFLAVTAGVFISIAFVFYITVTTGPAPATATGKTGRRRVLLAGPNHGGGLWRRFVHLDSIDGDGKSQRANKLATVNYQLDNCLFR